MKALVNQKYTIHHLHPSYKVTKFGPENAVLLEGKDNCIFFGALLHDVHLREPCVVGELGN